MRKIFILLVLLLTACQAAPGNDGASQISKASSITCTVAYRSDVSRPIEGEETITFGESNDEQAIRFTDMVFHAAYANGEFDGERALRLWVTPTDSDDIFHTQLYQLDPSAGPQNQFVGGHGFTGLGYLYHPTLSSELQFWCVAD